MKHFLWLIAFFVAHTQTLSQESVIQYLSGTGAENTVTWDFYCSAGMNSQQWNTIEVPSCWEQQGFGAYNYGHVPFDKRLKEEGHYKLTFDGSSDWKGKQVDLVFEGVMTDCEVILNGKVIGTHQGAFYEFSFDISDDLKLTEKNLLEVKVKKFSTNESVNQAERKADYWVFGGIFRPVYLKVSPKENIARVAIDAKANGMFKVDVFLNEVETAKTVEVSILDFDQNKQVKFEKDIPSKSDSIRLEGVFKNPNLWSPEFPNRYIILFKLKDQSGKVLHEVSQKIGFRTVEVREADGIYVNGEKTKFRGVNSHTFHPDYGRTSSEALSIQTVNTMKDMNMNAIRFSHYPHDKHLLNACDSLGLYVLNELAGWQAPSYDTQIGSKLLKEMIQRDVNNPSIIFWDNANEGGWNTAYDDYFAELDIQKREVLHPWGAFGKTLTSHYIRYNYLTFDQYAPRLIFFPTEFIHGLYDGGHGAGLDDYWQRMWDHPLCAGGFLWVLADEAIKRSDTGVLDSDGNHAPDGIVGPYFEKEGSFYTIKKIWSPIQLEDKYLSAGFDGRLQIENRFQFTNLNECQFEYRWVKFGIDGQKEILKKGTPRVPGLAALETGVMKVNLDQGWTGAHALEITATDPHGRQIYSWSYAVRRPKDIADASVDSPRAKKIKFKESDTAFIFTTGNGINIRIGKTDGLLKSVSRKDGLIPLSNGPLIIDNTATITEVKHEQDGDKHQVVVTLGKDEHAFIWTVEPGGLLRLDLEYEPLNNTYLAGIDFDFPEAEVERVNWMGNGPYRVWKNRLKGPEFGVWEKKYNNTITGHSGFIYPEFKGYHANTYWATITMKDNRSFKVYSKTDDLFLKLFNPEEAPDPRNTTVEHSAGDISFMNGIPAIGTKFTKPEYLGPQSTPNSYMPKRVLGRKVSINLVFDFSE